MTVHSGYVQDIRDGKRLKMDNGEWYSAFASSQCAGIAAGDYVMFSYAVSPPKPDGKTYNNIKGNVKKAAAPDSAPAPVSAGRPPATSSGSRPFPIPPLHGDRAIIRQNALGHAVRAVQNSWANTEMPLEEYTATIIDVARKFEAYSAGDLDMEIAEDAVRKMAASESH